MIQAELRGKLSESASLSAAERWEDVLTSSVFGLLRYLPATICLDFLSAAVNKRGQHIDLPAGPDIELAYVFWPTLPGWCREPDVVIDVKGQGPIARLVVEAKYLSGKTSYAVPGGEQDGEVSQFRDQLAEQYDLASADFGEGRVPGCIPPAVIYLTGHSSPPIAELLESIEHSTYARDEESPRLFWVGWWQLAEVLRKWRRELHEPAATVAGDLLDLLARRGQTLLFDAWANEAPNQFSTWEFMSTNSSVWWDVAEMRPLQAPWHYVADPIGRWFSATFPNPACKWRITDE